MINNSMANGSIRNVANNNGVGLGIVIGVIISILVVAAFLLV